MKNETLSVTSEGAMQYEIGLLEGNLMKLWTQISKQLCHVKFIVINTIILDAWEKIFSAFNMRTLL